MNGGVSFANFKDNTLYMSAADLFNKSQEGTSDKDVGLLGYMSFDYERHSFIEEYFDSIKQLILRIQNGDEDSNALVHFIDNSNPIMDKIVKMRLTLTKLKEGNGTYVSSLNEMLKNTGFTVDKFIKRAEHSINDLLTRYGKCIVKIKDEYPQLFKDRRYSELSYVQNKHRLHPEYYI
jgi:flagellar capping protein FliD